MCNEVTYPFPKFDGATYAYCLSKHKRNLQSKPWAYLHIWHCMKMNSKSWSDLDLLQACCSPCIMSIAPQVRFSFCKPLKTATRTRISLKQFYCTSMHECHCHGKAWSSDIFRPRSESISAASSYQPASSIKHDKYANIPRADLSQGYLVYQYKSLWNLAAELQNGGRTPGRLIFLNKHVLYGCGIL